MEFYASISCLLTAIYKILTLFLSRIDNFYGFHSITKLIFFFKELEDKDSFNISKKTNMIKEIIAITNSSINIDTESNYRRTKKIKNGSPLGNKKEKPKNLMIDNSEEDIKEINLYNIVKKKEENKNSRNNQIKPSTINTRETLGGEENNEKDNNNNYKTNIKKDRLFLNKKKINSRLRINVINNNNNLYSSEKRVTVAGSGENDSIISKNSQKSEQIDNSFNILELIITQICKCFMTHNMKIKNNAVNKAKKIVFRNLDVITYIRNNILNYRINQTLLDEKEKTLMNFLTRPIISIDHEEKDDFKKIYENFEDSDFDKYYERVVGIISNSKKEEKDKKLLSISNEHLKAFM